MPISAPGSSRRLIPRPAGRPATRAAAGAARGFTLLELLVVLAIIAVSVAAVSLSLRDSASTQLEREGERLAALLEMARAESRVTGTAVRWMPVAAGDGDAAAGSANFRFVGLTAAQQLPTRWLDERVNAQIPGANAVLLGPDAIIPAQRILLRLQDQRLEIATDGLGPFGPAAAAAAAP